MASLGSVEVPAGETVGLFSVAGATVANARIYVRAANSGPFRVVAGSDGEGEAFSLSSDFIDTSAELYMKNTSSEAERISVLIVPQPVGGGSGVTLPEGTEDQVLSFDEAGELIARSLAASDVIPVGTSNGQVLKWNGTEWAPGTDTNTTYTVLSASDAEAGTSTATRTISAKVLADEIDRRVAAALAAYTPPAAE